MAVFVRISAVLVGLANLTLYLYAGSSEALLGDDAGELPSWSGSLAFTLYAIVVGLVTAEILLRFLRFALGGSLPVRYAATVLGFCVGGVCSVLLLTVAVPLYATLTTEAGVSIPRSLILGAYFAVYAGLVGLLEGLLLGLPLAAVLGRFGTAD